MRRMDGGWVSEMKEGKGRRKTAGGWVGERRERGRG